MSKLVELLKYVNENNEFYRKIVKNNMIENPLDINQYPILTRKLLQQNRTNMFSRGYKSKYFSGKLKRQFSSGTSGVPVSVYWDEDEYYASMLPLWRKRMLHYNVTPTNKMVMFTLVIFDTSVNNAGLVKDNNTHMPFLKISRTSLKCNGDYLELIKVINDFYPKWVYIQPYILSKLMQTYKHHDIIPPDSIKYIESVGEILTPKVKNDASKFFGAPVINMYGTEEMNGIAIECPHNNMHVLDDNVYVECMTQEGISQYGRGETILTNLTNYGMPLIRYSQDDIIEVTQQKTPCACGSNSPIISIIRGRKQEGININGIELSTYNLRELVDEVNNIFRDPITDFSYVYSRSKNELLCRIVMQPNMISWSNNIKRSIKEIFFAKFISSSLIGFDVSIVNNCDFPFISNHKYTVLNIVD